MVLFPRWYTALKWGVPVALSSFYAAWVGLMLTGAMVPFASLNFLVTLYQATAGYQAFFFMMGAMIAVATMVGFMSSLLIRGLILFPVSENVAVASMHECELYYLRKKIDDLTRQHVEYETSLQHTIAELDDHSAKLTQQYNQMLGRFGVAGQAEQLSIPAPAASPTETMNSANSPRNVLAEPQTPAQPPTNHDVRLITPIGGRLQASTASTTIRQLR